MKQWLHTHLKFFFIHLTTLLTVYFIISVNAYVFTSIAVFTHLAVGVRARHHSVEDGTRSALLVPNDGAVTLTLDVCGRSGNLCVESCPVRLDMKKPYSWTTWQQLMENGKIDLSFQNNNVAVDTCSYFYMGDERKRKYAYYDIPFVSILLLIIHFRSQVVLCSDNHLLPHTTKLQKHPCL